MLDAFCRLEEPEGGWEIIAVDNASTDQTAAIIGSYSTQLPIVLLKEPRLGKNYAINRGLSYVNGDLIIFTDDDVIPSENWLVQWRKCADAYPGYSVFGGVIMPYWLKEPDSWILDNVPLGVNYAITEPDRQEGEILPGLVWGPNMAIRKTVFDLGHRFDGTIGPKGKNYVMGGEAEFVWRLATAGYTPWFCKSAVVQHIIRGYQLEMKWIMGRAFRSGRSSYRREFVYQSPPLDYKAKPFKLFGLPPWMFLDLLVQYKNYWQSLFNGNKQKQFLAMWEIHYRKGYLYEAMIFGLTKAKNEA